MSHYVLLDDQKTGISRYFSAPSDFITVYDETDLEGCFRAIETHLSNGKYLAGNVAYEFGYWLEPALRHLAPKNSKRPLLQFGVFDQPPSEAPINLLYSKNQPVLNLKSDWDLKDYTSRFKKIQSYIEAGDVYQINLTFPLRGKTDASPETLYAAFRRAQPGRYGGITNLSDEAIISFSPELFFEKTDNKMRMRPMKGTRPRREDASEDAALLMNMRNEPKSQAENLMIVDLLRNDLSRLCHAGSVKVPELFALETYPTLHQMTSQVEGKLEQGKNWRDIFTGLFPCGSVTGAPKIRAMEIIHDLESGPRHAYCGSMGYIAPDGTACFNVGIRTVQLKDNLLRYDVGSGVVLDSDAEDEYRECLLKADILSPRKTGVFETFRWEEKGAYVRREAHKRRLLKAAKAQRIACKESDVDDLLNDYRPPRNSDPQRVRMSLAQDETLSLKATPLKKLSTPLSLAVSKYPLSNTYQTTQHKVENRDFYDGERERLKASHAIDEVIFLDKNGYVCEGSFTSIFIKKEDQFFTPKAGLLLPGILRAEMIKSGEAKETNLTLNDLLEADEIFVGNSLRGLMKANLMNSHPL